MPRYRRSFINYSTCLVLHLQILMKGKQQNSLLHNQILMKGKQHKLYSLVLPAYQPNQLYLSRCTACLRLQPPGVGRGQEVRHTLTKT